MVSRPTRTVVAGELVALALAITLAIWREPRADWDIPLFTTLLALSVVSDLRAIEITAHRVKISGSLLSIVAAVVLMGSTPGAVIGVVTILATWISPRYSPADLLINLVTYAWFPLLAGAAFHIGVDELDLTDSDPTFYLGVFALFVAALAINTVIIAAYTSYAERSRMVGRLSESFLPLVPSELAAAVLAVGVTLAHAQIGITAVAFFAIVFLVFQHLVGELLLSQERADELEVRARQLAGFQVALLSALLRTLDLRDRMTARHSAAVARYARELAIRAGLSEADQELAHTAGLLHDIGKFVLPDEILKKGGRLGPDDWKQIQRHPYEGARIVSQVDGYSPVGEIILAHHERMDGLGYPRSLRGEDIPEIARIIAVADAYDVMTARDSYRAPISSFEAIAEMRRVAGTQLDARLVELFIGMLADKDLSYRHGEDADFEAELALDKRIHDHVAGPAA